jgi:hypothetical protein
LAQRVNKILSNRIQESGDREKKLFGAGCFLVGGNGEMGRWGDGEDNILLLTPALEPPASYSLFPSQIHQLRNKNRLLYAKFG